MRGLSSTFHARPRTSRLSGKLKMLPDGFRVASTRETHSLWIVETNRLSPSEKDALGRLLDDPSPAVRQALLARFEALGAEGSRFLREIASGSNRIIALTAGW